MTNGNTNSVSFLAETMMADSSFATAIKALTRDESFVNAWGKLDLQELCNGFNTFSEQILTYNRFHRAERRLWYIKIGKGAIPKKLETSLQRDVPAARNAYLGAFKGVDKSLGALSAAGFDNVVDKYIDRFLALLKDKTHPLRAVLTQYFHAVGCSSQMIDEFESVLIHSNYSPRPVLGTARPGELRDVIGKGIAAQQKLFDYTQANGLKYIKGQCDPPKWAVVASDVLGWFGLSFSPWYVILIVAIIVVLLTILCVTKALPQVILDKCKYLSLTLGFTM